MHDRIIKDCLEKQTPKIINEQDRIRLAEMLNVAIESADKKEELTVEFVRNLHKIFVAVPQNALTRDEDFMYYPGAFRNGCAGSSLTYDHITPGGLKEIFDMIQEEKKQHFPANKGTWIGPRKTLELAWNQSIHAGNIENKTLIEQLYISAIQNKLALFFARTNDLNLKIDEYVEKTFNNLIHKFNQDILKAASQEEQLKLITVFIKTCLRTGIFQNANHHVFLLGVMNFLLLKNLNSYCAFEVTSANFIGSSLEESLKFVKQNLVALNKPLENAQVQTIKPNIYDAIFQFFLPEDEKKKNANKTGETKPSAVMSPKSGMLSS